MAPPRILVLNGPNLNLLGRREPGIYGADTLDSITARLQELAATLDCVVAVRQSNHEGELVGWIHEAWDTAAGVVLNPGAFAHYSYSLRDAISAIEPPVVEVHISNIHSRETFRHESVIAPVALGMISGLGVHRALTGAVLYDKDSDVEKMWAHIHEPPPALIDVRPELPPALGDAVERALSKAPGDRQQTASELAREALAALAA